jgi:O-antigen ligase
MVPYYNDHTAYASAVSFFIPIFAAFAIESKLGGNTRFWSISILLLLVFAVIASYTRAAWLGLAGALGCYLIFLFRVKSWIIYSGLVATVIGLFVFQTELAMKLQHNNKVSSSDYSAHLQSMGNISSDDSNVERLNRWSCALRMFHTKPFFGYGPGTYMFKYGVFQKDSEKSGISTNAGTAGGSHSEYLGPLSEQGFLGTTIILLMIAVICIRAGAFIRRCPDRKQRALAKGMLLGLVTYWVHGFMNFFLDTEKASVPYWGFIAALVALDIYSNQTTGLNQPTTEQGNIVE